MNAFETLTLKKTPNLSVLMGRALLPSKKSKSLRLPPISLKVDALDIDLKHLRSYAKVCGFNPDTCEQQIPLTYPHMLAFPLHLELMLRKDFPYEVMGLVHVKNNITQHTSIDVTQKLNVECSFGTIEDHPKGKVFSIITEITQNDELCWSSVSSMLKRLPGEEQEPGTAKEKDKEGAVGEPDEQWKLPENLGRSYGAVSGDRNPIHLFSLSAKLFGFKQHIAHGMWTKARCAAALSDQLSLYPCSLDVEFKLPVFLPGTVNFYSRPALDGADIEVYDKEGLKPHLKGKARFRTSE